MSSVLSKDQYSTHGSARNLDDPLGFVVELASHVNRERLALKVTTVIRHYKEHISAKTFDKQ